MTEREPVPPGRENAESSDKRLPQETLRTDANIKSTETEVMKTMEKTTMSVQELSTQMGISLPKAYELVKTPGFPSIRIGTRILIPIDAFREWLVITSNKEE